jgi:3-oxoacyl-[acyl-carrier-protein] synthase-3
VSVGVAASAAYLPERWMTAAEIADASGIPEDVLVEKFGVRGKHIAAPEEHVSDLCVKAAERLLAEHDVEPASVDAVVYFGSMWRDYSVWQAAPWIAHRLGCENAVALEYGSVSSGGPLALRFAKNYLVADDGLQNVLLVGASRESYLLDYENERSRFMFNFGDGAVAMLLHRDALANELLASDAVTDGSLSLQVKVPSGGSVDMNGGYRFLDVEDPAAMKSRLDEVSLPNFVRAARGALDRSGTGVGEIDFLCALHMKRSMHDELVTALGVDPDRTVYLDDTGHMSGVDPLLGLDRAARSGQLRDGDVVLLLAAGTGYTWAASVVRWGPITVRSERPRAPSVEPQ